MTTFYIARHGETENNRAGRLSGWVDTPLTQAGLASTQKAIAKLDGIAISEIYSSDLGRAFITAYVVARDLGLTNEIKRMPGLREVDYGNAANMPSAEAYKLYPKLDSDTHYAPPNGESLDHMQKRILATLDALNNAYSSARVLLVCHSGVIAAIHANYLHTDFGQHNISEAYPHDYVAAFTYKDGQIDSWKELT